jgi:hypothetical protein
MSAQLVEKKKPIVVKGPIRATLTEEQRKTEAQKIQRELETLKQRIGKLVDST